MCEFHLKGNCFHPELVGKGNIADQCDVHSCNKCTNKQWQAEKIDEELAYHQALLDLITGKDEIKHTTIIQTERNATNISPLKLAMMGIINK